MRRVLLAEDDADIRSLAKLLLELADHEVIEAPDGDVALAVLDQDDAIDVVLLDLRLPMRNGFEVMAKLRESGRLHDGVKVVVFSAQIEAEDRARAESHGATGFLEKPFSEDDLLAAVEG